MNVIMLSVVMLSVVMLSVVMLSVVVPRHYTVNHGTNIRVMVNPTTLSIMTLRILRIATV